MKGFAVPVNRGLKAEKIAAVLRHPLDVDLISDLKILDVRSGSPPRVVVRQRHAPFDWHIRTDQTYFLLGVSELIHAAGFECAASLLFADAIGRSSATQAWTKVLEGTATLQRRQRHFDRPERCHKGRMIPIDHQTPSKPALSGECRIRRTDIFHDAVAWRF
jgi:hypothetical protein